MDLLRSLLDILQAIPEIELLSAKQLFGESVGVAKGTSTDGGIAKATFETIG